MNDECIYNEYTSPTYRNSVGQKYNELIKFTQKSLKTELLETGIITENIWKNELIFCNERLIEIKKNNSYTFNSNNDHYNIRFGKIVCIEHILSLRFYSKYINLAIMFNKSYIDINEHYKKFYWFGRFLFEMIEFVGKSMIKHKEKIYMILNKNTLFKEFNMKQIFEKPIFCTRDYSLIKECVECDNFKKNEYMILTLIANKRNETRYIEFNKLLFNCKSECDMLLFFGYTNNLIIDNIEIWSDDLGKIIDFKFEMKCLNYWSSLMGDDINVISNGFNDEIDDNSNDIKTMNQYIQKLISLIDIKSDDHNEFVVDDKLKFVSRLFNYYGKYKNGTNIVLSSKNEQFIRNNINILNKLYPKSQYVCFK